VSAHDDHLDPDRHLYSGEHEAEVFADLQAELAAVKRERDESRRRWDELLGAKTKPEPSRLEIAAMLSPAVVQMGCAMDLDAQDFAAALLQVTDALIAKARKEVAK